MPEAVIFDFYGTLARWAETSESSYPSSYAAVFADFGYALPASVLDGYFSRYDGVDHAEHSIDQETYETWVRFRLSDLARTCGVNPDDMDAVVDALRALDQADMVAYPEARETLRALRQAGMAIGVCSNWGWELDAFLDRVDLLDLVDSGVTSARAGWRKPHPAIYDCSVRALGIEPERAVFVGDSWEPDVRGPRRLGMEAIHVWRTEDRVGQDAPPLEPGDHRVSNLSEVLSIVGVS